MNKFLLFSLLFVMAFPAFTLEVIDDEGSRISLKEPAQRIVSLAPHITENLFTAGAGGQVVGAVAYSNFPPEAEKISSIGSYRAFNLEAILALKPDLVVAWRSGNGDAKIARLKSLGLTVFVEDPKRLEDIAGSIRRLGVLSGHGPLAEQAGSQFLHKLAQLRERYEGQRAVDVFYQVWDAPLQTLNGEHLISDVIRLCGGRNVFSDATTLAPQVNVEGVIAADPEVIIAGGMGEFSPEWLDDWKPWPAIRAVRNEHLYFINPNHLQRHTSRILLGAETMCQQLRLAR